jgi:hypothetical protein
MTDNVLVIASIYPDLLGTYGDSGNVIAAASGRAAWDRHRGDAVQPGDAVPNHATLRDGRVRTPPRWPPARR